VTDKISDQIGFHVFSDYFDEPLGHIFFSKFTEDRTYER
jgi:hypothetical protein